MRHDYRGIGRTLLEALRAHSKLRDTKQFELYCQPDMIPYYETMGFGDIFLVPIRPKTAKESLSFRGRDFSPVNNVPFHGAKVSTPKNDSFLALKSLLPKNSYDMYTLFGYVVTHCIAVYDHVMGLFIIDVETFTKTFRHKVQCTYGCLELS